MSQELADREAQWLAQMAAMRQAIADLKLPPLLDELYGADLLGHEEETSSDCLSDDIWEVSSDFDESPVSEDGLAAMNGVGHGDQGADVHDQVWLRKKCYDFANIRSGMSGDEVYDQITAVLASDSTEDELQMSLADIVGYDDLDFVIELISHRRDVLAQPAITNDKEDGILGQLETKAEREERLRQHDQQHKRAPLAPAHDRSGPQYPHVYKSASAASGNTLDVSGRPFALPVGSNRSDHLKYEEYSIPATKVGSVAAGQKLVAVSEMDGLCKRTFKGYKGLNRMQSLLYPVAYHTSENMLICAPTGAGKTDAAMLTILHAISKNTSPNPQDEPNAEDFTVLTNDFKIIYVAPMKALAAEVTEKLGKRLQWLGVQVRELTGDMQLTKKEIAATQIIVTTPEKWDVVTRKSTGDTELVQKVRLLVIDEVSL